MTILRGYDAKKYLKSYVQRDPVLMVSIDYFINHISNSNIGKSVELFVYINHDIPHGAGVLYKTIKQMTLFGSDEAIESFTSQISNSIERLRVPFSKMYSAIKGLEKNKMLRKYESVDMFMTTTSNTFKENQKFKAIRLETEHAKDIANVYTYENATELEEKAIEEFIKQGITFYGVYYNSKLVAVCQIPFMTDKVWYISNVRTLPKYRGLGLGKSLISTVVKDAFTYGKEYVALTVANDNFVARRIYEKLGFSVYERFYSTFVW